MSSFWTSSSKRILILLLHLCLVGARLGTLGGAGACPTTCNCMWKGGKQTVECTERRLITIPSNVDPETQVLDMSNNDMQILPNETFVRAGLLNLQKVYMRKCNIGEINDRAFQGLTNLVELDLSENLLTSIPSGAFHDTPFLRELNLNGNPIQKIESHAFQMVSGLVKLDLSNCKLKSIAPKAFDGIKLESIKLNGNELTELRQKTVETLGCMNPERNRQMSPEFRDISRHYGLHGIDLHNNPWICDCRMRAVKEWLEDCNIPYSEDPVCYGPERVGGRKFTDLHLDDFACKPEILPVNRYVEATTGENASIVCKVGAVPPASVTWYWNGRQLNNNTVVGMGAQRVVIYEEGRFDKSSALVLTNAQEDDSSDFYCMAENRAGMAEANFTLHVALRTAGMSTLGSGQIAGLSAALVILILFILLVILVLLVRLRRLPFTSTKTPTQVEQGKPADVDRRDGKVVGGDIKTTANPIQKPPRLTEISYTTSHYDGNGSVINTSWNAVPRPSANNPDLINEAERAEERKTEDPTKKIGGNESNKKDIDETALEEGKSSESGVKIPNGHIVENPGDLEIIGLRPKSGEYNRIQGESLYPSGLWDGSTPTGSTADLFLRRTTSASFDKNMDLDASDKTPIIGDGSLCSEEEFNCRTFPRHHTSSSAWKDAALYAGGYPPDYGLPIPEPQQKVDSTDIPGPQVRLPQDYSGSGVVHYPTASTPSPTGHRTPPGLQAPPSSHPSAKTLRVWQRGVPVLPPVTALKRVLARDSPDEGYQEGCGTDV